MQLSRVHEAWIETGDPHRAVAVGIGATARVITTAAAIMVVVFASFVLSTDPTVKMLAIGMAFAVLIDASLVRMILVPSIMALLDARTWWMPRWLEPIVPAPAARGQHRARRSRRIRTGRARRIRVGQPGRDRDCGRDRDDDCGRGAAPAVRGVSLPGPALASAGRSRARRRNREPGPAQGDAMGIDGNSIAT